MSGLPPGWIVAIDPSSGRDYYANPVSGESSWRFPGRQVSPKFPPPPPPPREGFDSKEKLFERRTPAGGSSSYAQAPTTSTTLPQPSVPVSTMDQRFVPPNFHPKKDPGLVTNNINPAVSIKTLASNGALVPAARAVMDAQARDNERFPDLELQALTAGQIADLCSIQQDQRNGANQQEEIDIEPYVPINPYSLNESAKGKPMEFGRLDIRVASLYDKLKKIKQ